MQIEDAASSLSQYDSALTRIVPESTYTPRKHLTEELDALGVDAKHRDGCVDYYADYAKCTITQMQTSPMFHWKKRVMEYCFYYNNQWWWCERQNAIEKGLARYLYV